jgi:dimethylargininase
VYVRPPEPDALRRWRDYGWRAAPDPARAAAEHEAFRDQLADAGAEVFVGAAPSPGDPDAVYVYDPALMTDAGAILLRPAKEGRRGEPAVAAADLEAAGIPVVATLGDAGGSTSAEGGDLCWLDRRTLLAGVGYRTTAAGLDALRALLPDVRVVAFDLPHLAGPAACTHLLSFLSILDEDLVVASLPHLPVRLVELLRARDIRFVEVPADEFDSMGPNVLALGPRIALALEGNPETRRRMEAAGVDVRTYVGEEISRKGDGGPTCLTRPLRRG